MLVGVSMKNLELKATLSNKEALKKVKELNIKESYDFEQVDMYFNVSSERLKLRIINGKEYELISYSRPDILSAKDSNYEIYVSQEPEKLQMMLISTLGLKVTVEKRRKVFIYNDCRIHVDNVVDLGEFIEFEVVMIDGRTEEEAQQLMQFLMNHFQITDEKLIHCSYSDLLLAT